MDKQESSQTLVLDSWLLSDSWLSRPVSPVSHPPLEVDGGRTTRASRSAGRKAPTCPTLWRLTTATSAFERMMSSWRAEDCIPIVFCHLNGEKDHEPAWWFGIYHPRHHYLYLFYIYYIYIYRYNIIYIYINGSCDQLDVDCCWWIFPFLVVLSMNCIPLIQFSTTISPWCFISSKGPCLNILLLYSSVASSIL